MPNSLEAQLVRQYLDGDERALNQIVERWVKPVFSFVYRYIGNTQDAEDVTQEVFFKAWRSLARYNQEMLFSTWLFAIARNTAIDWLRKKRPMVFSTFESDDGEVSMLDTLVDTDPLPDEMVARLEDKEEMSALLAELSANHREVVMMHYYDHLTFDEIANITKKPLNTIKSHHRRAILVLKKLKNAPN